MRSILLLRFLVRKLRQAFFLVAYVSTFKSQAKADRAQNANEQSLEMWNLDHDELSRIEEADDTWLTLLRTQVLDFLKNRNDRTRAEDVRQWFRGLNGEEIIGAENQEPTDLHPAGLPERARRQFFDRERFLWKLRRVALILFGGVEIRNDPEEEAQRQRFLGACVQFFEKIEAFLSDPAQFKRPRRTLFEAYREVQKKVLDADDGKTYLQGLKNRLKEKNEQSFRLSEARMLDNWRSWWTARDLTSEADSEGSARQRLALQREAVSLGRKFEGEANGGSPILWRILSGSVLDPYLDDNGLARHYFMGNDDHYLWQARSFDRETQTVKWQRPLGFAFLFLCVPHLEGISKSELLHPHPLIGGVGRLAANFREVVLDLAPGIPDEEGKKVSAEQLEKKTSWRKVHTLMRSRVWRELIAGTGGRGRKAKQGCDSALDELLQTVSLLVTADELVDIRVTLNKLFPPPRLATARPLREEQWNRNRQAEERAILEEIKDIRAQGGREAARVGLIEELLAYLQDEDVRFFSGGWTRNEEEAGREAWQGLRTMVQTHAKARQQLGHLLPPLGRDLADDLETHEDPQRGLYAAEIALWSAVGLLFVAGGWVGVLLHRKCRERAKLLSSSREKQRRQVALAGRVGEERAPSVILVSPHLGDPCRLPLSPTRHGEWVKLDFETEGAPAAALPAEVPASLFTGGNTRQALMGLDDWNTVPAQVLGGELERDGSRGLISYQEVAPVRR